MATKMFGTFIKAEKTDAIHKIAAVYGGKPVKNGYRFTAKTNSALNKISREFIAALPAFDGK
jgi:hypothetical protein